MDTDDEIEAVRRMEEEEKKRNGRSLRFVNIMWLFVTLIVKMVHCSPEKSKAADDLDSDDAYNADTDVDEDAADDDEGDFPPLPDFFAGRVFVLFVSESDVRKVTLNRMLPGEIMET